MNEPLLHINDVDLPIEPQFEIEVEQVLELLQTNNESNNFSERIIEKSKQTIKIILEGLYQIHCSHSESARFLIPMGKDSFTTSAPHNLHSLSYVVINRVIDSLVSMKWITFQKGYIKSDESNVCSYATATKNLKNIFVLKPFEWKERVLNPRRQIIILRNRLPESKEKIDIAYTQNKTTRNMHKNLYRINTFLNQNAICLHLLNSGIEKLALEISTHASSKKEKPKMLNFANTQLRRVFSRGSFKKGGRFYGGWWQNIPKKYRPYITINGFATCEIDFSEMHPRIMYHRQGISPPKGDLYDIGLRDSKIPYDKEVEPYYSQRKIIKRFFNALINDESGQHTLTKEDSKFLGMSTNQLKNQLIDRHPILREILRKGKGLEYQYLDSQIAEKILLKLLDKGIVCLPIHDSFICSLIEQNELKKAMQEAYEEVLSHPCEIKGTTTYKSEFRLDEEIEGETHLEQIANQHEEQIHNIFVRAKWRSDNAKRETVHKKNGTEVHTAPRPYSGKNS